MKNVAVMIVCRCNGGSAVIVPGVIVPGVIIPGVIVPGLIVVQHRCTACNSQCLESNNA